MRRLSREEIAQRVALDILPGSLINLGIGMPELVGNYLASQDEVVIHCENGVIGSGPIVDPIIGDYDLINAGRKTISLRQGGHFIDHVDSFALVRGGHLDVAILGAFQVSSTGDLANWSTGLPSSLPSPGGAMDLAIGAKLVYVMMNLFDQDGNSRLVGRCSFPLTAQGVVKRLYTDLGVFQLSADGASIVELVRELEYSELERKLDIKFIS